MGPYGVICLGHFWRLFGGSESVEEHEEIRGGRKACCAHLVVPSWCGHGADGFRRVRRAERSALPTRMKLATVSCGSVCKSRGERERDAGLSQNGRLQFETCFIQIIHITIIFMRSLLLISFFALAIFGVLWCGQFWAAAQASVRLLGRDHVAAVRETWLAASACTGAGASTSTSGGTNTSCGTVTNTGSCTGASFGRGPNACSNSAQASRTSR